MSMDKDRLRSRRRLREHEDEDEDEDGKRSPLWHLRWALPAAGVVLLLGLWAFGVFAPAPKIRLSTDPDAKLKLERLFQAYRAYCDRNQKGPPNEQALRDFLQKQPPEEKSALNLPDNLDELFVNPRDGQKYEIQWGSKMDPLTGSNRAMMWEKTTNSEGTRWVALAIGYVVSTSDQNFKSLKK
jgi:hypothetical protein